VNVPHLHRPAPEQLVLEGAQVVQATFEHAGSSGGSFLPPGLVPTIPTLVTLLVIHVPDGPLGTVTVAQVRVSCRSGSRARALVVDASIDAAPAVAARLAEAWGIGGTRGGTSLTRSYHQVVASSPRFEVAVVRPHPIGVHDVQYVAGLHPVLTGDGPRLVQVELRVELDRVERGRPVLHRFERSDGLDPRSPVAATSGVGTVTLPAVRFVLHPDLPPHLGTEPAGARA